VNGCTLCDKLHHTTAAQRHLNDSESAEPIK
jgi:hypothetical protein